MREYTFFALLFFAMEVNAQSLIDKDIERIATGALAEEISYCTEDAVRYAGVVVQETKSGNIVANVSLLYKDGEFVKNPVGNTTSVPTGLGRSVLYLAMMPEANPYMQVDTKDGLYIDSEGYSIEDHNHRHGGYGVLDLKRAFDCNSDIGILKCAEAIFEKDMHKYAEAINKTGIFFGAKAATGYEATWHSRDILGFTSPMSLLQQVCWINAVAGGKFVIRLDEKDSSEPYDEILNHEGLDSLRSAMRECVTRGIARRMRSEYTSVAAITNKSPKDVEGNKGLFAAGFFPYEAPEYSFAVYIIQDSKKGYATPSYVAHKIIDWMTFNKLKNPPYLSFDDRPTSMYKESWVHPAER